MVFGFFHRESRSTRTSQFRAVEGGVENKKMQKGFSQKIELIIVPAAF